MKRRNARGSYKWYKKESEENSMEGRGRSRRRNTHQAWKKRLSSVLAVVLTAVMILNMPLSIDGLRMHVSDAFASASNVDRDSGVWATASNAKYRKGDSGDVDIYVIADDNRAVPGNTTSMTLYLKNNTDQAISEGVLTFSGRYINKEDAIFQDVGSGEEYEQIIAGGGPGQAGEESGEGLIYQESEETADETMAPDAAESIGSADEGIETADPVLPEDSGSEGDEEEEEAYKLTNIDLLPGELHEVHFEFYTDDDVKSTKANVSFSFRGENEEGSRVTGDTKFYYSIGLPTVNFSMEDGMQIESGISNDLEIWMSEPDWVDEDLQDRLDEQEEKEEEENDAADTASDSDASKASDSNASKDNTASDSNAGKDSSTSQKDEEKIQKYTEEAMEISSSRVSYTVEIYGADYSEFHPRKAGEAEDIGWISCVYEVDRNTKPGIYYGKVTATGKWNKKSFTSEQGFLFEVTGEGWAGQEFTAELDAMTVHAYAEEGVLPEGVQLAVKELREDDAQTAEKFQEAVDALEQEGTAYDGMMAVDITFVDEDGQEIEPDGEVQVSIEMKKGALPEGVDLETVEIHHLKETDANTIEVEKVADGSDQTDGTVQTPEDAKAAMEEEAVPEERIEEAVSQDAEAVAAFSVDSFSTFTITWGGGWNQHSLTVHYVDTAGHEIFAPDAVDVELGDNVIWIDLDEYKKEIKNFDCIRISLNRYDGTSARWVRYSRNSWRYSDSPSKPSDYELGNQWRNNNGNVYIVYNNSLAVDELTKAATVDSTSQGVHMYMFNYDGQAFSGGEYGSENGSTKTGIASTTVNADTGWPSLTGAHGTPTRRSFRNYFGGTNSAYNLEGNLDDNGREVNYLFLKDRYDDNGQYYFNSAEYFATLEDNNDDDFTVYNQLGTPGTGDSYFYQRGNFMPYNTLDLNEIRNYNLYDDTGAELDENDERVNEPLYGFNEREDFYFGMYVWADFYQPQNGEVEDASGDKSDMVFEFTGDDDMWVYIDGVLVLDLGGIHDAQSGSINFSTGEVKWTDTETNEPVNELESTLYQKFVDAGMEDSVKWQEGKETFADGSNHRIQIFYMERGAGASNLKMSFNLKTIPDGQLSVRKDVENYYAPQLADIEYTMQVTTTVNGEEVPYANAEYTLFEQTGEGVTDKEGRFKIKYDETAVFSDIDVGTKVNVREVGSSDAPEGAEINPGYDISYVIRDSAGKPIGGSSSDGTASAEMPAYGSINVVVTNTATFTRPLQLVKNFQGTEGNTAPENFKATYTLYEVTDTGDVFVGSVKYSDLTETTDETSASYTFWLDTGKRYKIVETFGDDDNDGGTADLPWQGVIMMTNDPAVGTAAEDGIVFLETSDEVSGDDVDTITLTNVYAERMVTITVDKVVTGNMGDKNEDFHFNYTYTDNGAEVNETFTLKDTTKPEEIEIPYGASITIVESDNGSGYTTTYTAVPTGETPSDSGTAGTSCSLSNVTKNMTVTFTNERDIQIPTGFGGNYYPYLMMLAIAAIGTTGFIYPACRRRRHKGDK